MKKRFHAIVTALLVLYLTFPALGAFARTSADDLMGIGVPAEWAKYISEKLIHVNSAGNLVLEVATGKNAVVDKGSLVISEGGGTLHLQEGTAGSACMGTATLTAATPVVVSTTCAKTGARIFITRTSLDADTSGDAFISEISNGVSFSITSETSDTGTVNWIIFNEAA